MMRLKIISTIKKVDLVKGNPW